MKENKDGVLVMTEEFWATSQLSVAKYSGSIIWNGKSYTICNKDGLTIFKCSEIAEKKNLDYAIPPGEPADLVRDDFIPTYKKIGRDNVIRLLTEKKTLKEIKEFAKTYKKK